MVILLAVAALAVDLGRMYVIKSELQAFTDAAALSEACQLDGSDAGNTRARAAAESLTQGPNAMKWDMGTQAISGIDSRFESKDGQRSARVTVTAPAPLIFLRAFQSLNSDFATVAATSVALKTSEAARLIQ
jgi:uncharacterized membrane protein